MMKTIKCYVDGSYSPKSNFPDCAGWGVLFEDGEQKSGTTPHLGMNQVAGELEAVYQALRIAIRKEVHLVRIFFDYEGVHKWATKQWKAKNFTTKKYQDMFTIVGDTIIYGHENDDHKVEVRFIKVDASQNRADALATASLGIRSVH
jgi:ribonuclease HI